MQTLVIGGCGFIGSHIVDVLLRNGVHVRVLDRQPERFRDRLKGVEYAFGSFLDRMTLAEALSGIDTVYHAVSTTFPGTADLDPVSDVRENLCGTLSLLDLMREIGTRRIVYLSSGGTVYGIPEVCPVPESHSLRPIGSYGIVKSAVEQYLSMYERRYGLHPVVVRASNPYGPRQGHSGVQGVISTFLSRVATGQTIEVWGDGSVVRDYIHVRDLAEFCVLAGRGTLTGAVNVGSGEGTSLNEIIAIIRRISQRDPAVQYRAGRPVDVPVSILDISRARQDFGWMPTVRLYEGIEETWSWLLEKQDIC